MAGLIGINNDIFQGMRSQFDALLQGTIRGMVSKGSREASLSLKLDITLIDESKPDEDTGEIIEKLVPSFEHKITATIQYKSELKGNIDIREEQLEFDEEKQLYILKKSYNPQLNMLDK